MYINLSRKQSSEFQKRGVLSSQNSTEQSAVCPECLDVNLPTVEEHMNSVGKTKWVEVFEACPLVGVAEDGDGRETSK